MLLEIIESEKEKLMVELTTGDHMITNRKEESKRFDMVNIFLDLLNANIFWSSVAEQLDYLKRPFLSDIRDLLFNLKLKNETKEFLQFCCLHNRKNFARRLFRMEKILLDVMGIAEKHKIKNQVAIEYINLMYSPREIKAEDDKFSLFPYQSLLVANNIDSEAFYHMLLLGRYKDNNKEKVFEWIKPQVNNKIQLNLFKRLLFDSSILKFDLAFLKSFPMDEILEYLRIQSQYENSCTKYRVSFVDEVLVLSYIELLKNNTSIRKCENCGMYFISRHGSKACSQKCKDEIIEGNKKKRENKEAYSKTIKAIKRLGDRIRYYQNRFDEIGYEPDSIQYDALLEFEFVYEYYRWICKKINNAILNDNAILRDEELMTNLYHWLESIASQPFDFYMGGNPGSIMYYKLLKNGYEPHSCFELLDNKEFMQTSEFVLDENVNKICRRRL